MVRRDPLPKALAAALGFLVWGAVALAGGERGPGGAIRPIEACDSPLYTEVGLPAMAAALFAMGWLRPRGAWRWWACPTAGTAVALVVFLPPGRSLNLRPPTIVAVATVTAPMLAAAYLGALSAWLVTRLGDGPPPPRS